MNIRFPETDVVACVFSLRSNDGAAAPTQFDERGVLLESAKRKAKEYHYRVPEYLKGQLEPGDFVVVYCQTGYQLGQVTKINEFSAVESSKLASVVAKFSLTDYFIDLNRQETLKAMKAALVKERKRLEEQVTWDLIASKSPEFKEMLEVFRAAGGQL